MNAELELVDKVKDILLKINSRSYKTLNQACDDHFQCEKGLECDSRSQVCRYSVGNSCETNNECVSGTSCSSGECKRNLGEKCGSTEECFGQFKCVAGKCEFHGEQIFTHNDQFEVPDGLKEVRILVVCGGGGGANGHQGGGGSGYIKSSVVDVSDKFSIPITVGTGGSGALRHSSNDIEGNSNGGSSAFGSFLSVDGGKTSTDINSAAADGGSGGGGSCNLGKDGGKGGSSGADGESCDYDGGQGQGRTFVQALYRMKNKSFSSGSGATGGYSSHAGGGGGGGVLIDGEGPQGEDGAQGYSGQGGKGFGGGGGAGGYESSVNYRAAGGAGAPGLVYVEW